MSSAFNADEIFQIAERIEVNGADFYNRAAQQSKDASVRTLFIGLAAMEQQHRVTFADLRQQLGDAARSSTAFDPNDESASYLQSLADSRVFDAGTKTMLTGAESAADVLRRAIGLEQDSISLYVGLAELVPAAFGRDRISAIIREEMRHVTVLTAELVRQK